MRIIPVMPNTPEWLSERKNGIGGSDSPAVLGLSKWRSPLEIYFDKIDPKLDLDPKILTEDQLWGLLHEPTIRQQYANRTGHEVTTIAGICQSEENPWMLATVDGVCQSEGILIEIKTANSRDGWGEPGTDEIPDAYKIQVHHNMSVTGLEVAHVPVLIGKSDFRIYIVHADKGLQRIITDKESRFWESVQRRIPPKPKTNNDMNLIYKNIRKNAIAATPEIYELYQEISDLKLSIQDLEEKKKEAQLKVKSFMGENDSVIWGDDAIFTWKETKGRASLNIRALKQEEPDIYNKFLETSESGRMFLTK